jgi:hypothetical protein
LVVVVVVGVVGVVVVVGVVFVVVVVVGLVFPTPPRFTPTLLTHSFDPAPPIKG